MWINGELHSTLCSHKPFQLDTAGPDVTVEFKLVFLLPRKRWSCQKSVAKCCHRVVAAAKSIEGIKFCHLAVILEDINEIATDVNETLRSTRDAMYCC